MKTKKLHTPHWRHLLLLLVCLTSIGKGHAQYYQFQTDYDEEVTEICCPECGKIFEVDWDDDEDLGDDPKV